MAASLNKSFDLSSRCSPHEHFLLYNRYSLGVGWLQRGGTRSMRREGERKETMKESSNKHLIGK
jgi:hypothetical protein